MAYGGGNWVDYINNAGSGINQTGIDLFRADNAFETVSGLEPVSHPPVTH